MLLPIHSDPLSMMCFSVPHRFDSGSNRLIMSSLSGFRFVFLESLYNNVNPFGFFPTQRQGRSTDLIHCQIFIFIEDIFQKINLRIEQPRYQIVFSMIR